MRVCFIGHRTIERTEKIILSLKETVLMLIQKGASKFLFGGMCGFDNLAWEVVTELKEAYPFIERVYVRERYQHIDASYKKFLLKSYEDTYFSPELERAGKYSYVERNYEMIDKSTYCVFYYNEKYLPPLKKQSKGLERVKLKRNSGTKIAYDYAIKRKKEIINLYK